jgi:hypothetical protein
MAGRLVAVAAGLAFATVAAAAGLTYAEAAALSDRDEEALPAEAYQRLVAAHGEAIGQALTACVDSSYDKPTISISVIVELDAHGRVTRSWRRDEDGLTTCVERQFTGALRFVPPRAPFYTGVSLDLDVNRDR